MLLPQLLVSLFQGDLRRTGRTILEEVNSRILQFDIRLLPGHHRDHPFRADAAADAQLQDAPNGPFIDRAINDSIRCRLGKIGKVCVL